MRRLRILTWPVHGSYFNTLSHLDHDWFLPIKPGSPEGFGGRGQAPYPESIRDIPAEEIANLDLDLILFQSERNLREDIAILGDRHGQTPRIYLEHNTPFPDPVNSRHPFADQPGFLVHVTRYNEMMWDNGTIATIVIEHSVAIDPGAVYAGFRPEGITVINSMPRRGRKVGPDLLQAARQQVPIRLAGFENDGLGDLLGDIPYPRLHAAMAEYRFLFSPCRYTSLPLAVIEALTIGMPVVALATTELPDVIVNGVHGYISNDIEVLMAGMRRLIADHDHARDLGAKARELARQRFGLDRFRADWDNAFHQALHLRA